MKAVSIAQPYASLVVAGVKRIETRSWRTRYRGPLAIHASRSTAYLDAHRGAERAPMRQALAQIGASDPRALPIGALLGVVYLDDVLPIDLDNDDNLDALADRGLTVVEANVGDYSTGRFAWCLSRARALRAPIAAAGALSLWQLPEHARASLETLAQKGSR